MFCFNVGTEGENRVEIIYIYIYKNTSVVRRRKKSRGPTFRQANN